MTRRHFIAFAAALKAAQPTHYSKVTPLDSQETARRMAYLDQWRRDVATTADVCARFNPAFDRARFLAACGVEG
jgi:acetyl-CoA acetyltransferase